MTKITRRHALAAGIATGAASCGGPTSQTDYVAKASSNDSTIFRHGVASGDPSGDGFVIWTRVSLDDAPIGGVQVIWEIASDRGFANLVANGMATASASADWTVKKVIKDLTPGQSYYFRFNIGEASSPIGHARTLPNDNIEDVSFAVVSCSNYPYGYFNVYDLISRQENIQAVIHLGDYFYEYGTDGYGGETGKKLDRNHIPSHEIITLGDYRARHAQYKSDPSAQAMHAAHTLIAIWDDHESANDSWKDGAENHDPKTEGNWSDRKRAALQAYYEWMPVRDPERGHPKEALFKSYSFGNLLSITALESRLMARSGPIDLNKVVPTLKTSEDVQKFKDDILGDPSRELLGASQLEFVENSLADSVAAGHPWQLIANQVIMAEVQSPDLNPHVTEEEIVALETAWDQGRAFIKLSALGLPSNLDAWDGFPAARERLYDATKKAGAPGIVVLTGDTHTWWANDLKSNNGDKMGVELGVHSVTSPSLYDKSFLGGKGAEYALLTNQENKAVKYLSGENHGYISLNVSKKRISVDYMAVTSVETTSYSAFRKVGFDIEQSANGPKFSGTRGLGLKEKFLF